MNNIFHLQPLRIILMTLVLTCFSIAQPIPVFAKTATPAAKLIPSPTPTPSPTPNTTQSLKDRIQKALEKERGTVRGTTDVGKIKRVVVGEVQRVTEKTLTIKNHKGTQIFTISAEAIVTKNDAKFDLNDIAVGDWVLVMGYKPQTDEEFTVKRVEVSPTSLQTKNFLTLLGSLKSISKTQLVITTKLNREDQTFSIGKSTTFQDSDGNTIKRETVETDLDYLLIGTQDADQKSALILRSLVPTKGS